MHKKKLVGAAVVEGDVLKTMYEEAPSGIDLGKIGEITLCVKVSDVTFDIQGKRWVAIDRITGKIVATDKTRKGCVRKEHAHYSSKIARTSRAFSWDK